MTRFVTFNGQTKFRPGGITKINANALTPIGATSLETVAILGEAEGGEPQTVITIDDPALAVETFRAGPLADAIRLAFEPSSDLRLPGGAFRVLAYKTNLSVQSSTHLPGDEALIADTAAGVPTTTVIDLTTGGLTVDAHIGRFAQFPDSTPPETRRIVDNTATQITVSPPLNSAPTASDTVNILETQVILTSKDYGAHTDQLQVEFEAGATPGTYVVTTVFEDTTEQSPEIGGDQFLRLKYVGGAAFNGTGNVTNIDATGLVITTDLTAAGLDDAAGMILQFDDGTQREILSNTTGASAVYTLIAGHALSADKIVSLATAGVTVRNVTSATANIAGASGVATTLTSTVAPVADNLNVTFTNNQTLRSLVDQINLTTNYEATIPGGVNPDTTLMETFDFGTRATGVDVRFDDEITPTTAGSFLRDLQVVVDWVNDYSELITATRATAGAQEGSELPAVTGGVVGTVGDVFIGFTGGARGTSANADWQAGFDALANERHSHIIPLISQDLTNEGNGSSATLSSVAAQLLAHVVNGRGSAQNEAGGYMGMSGTRAEIIARAQAFNDTDIQLFGQKPTVLNAAGTETELDEWGFAVMAAGAKAGAPEVGTSLTYKTLKTSAISQDSGWSPKDKTDVNLLLQNGVMVMEQAPTGNFRVIRDITTHLLDDNVAYINGDTRHAVRYVAYDLRQSLEDKFTGVKATPANAADIRDFVSGNRMVFYKDEGIIVESLNSDGQLVPGFEKLRVFISGNVATIRVCIFPTTSIVFQLNDIFLQLPTISL